MEKIKKFIEKYQKKNLLDIKPGDTVRVHERFLDRGKERVQVFEGIVIAKKHGSEIGATITVRRVLDGVGVEKTFPLHSPTVLKVEIVKRAKVRRAKLYYLRNIIGKIRLKRKNIDIELIEKPEKDKEKIQEVSENEESEAEHTKQENEDNKKEEDGMDRNL